MIGFYETEEYKRKVNSEARFADWKKWGPYLSERAWGTVREDYSAGGSVWNYLPHDHARSRAYRWNEDGLGGFCNRFQNICLSVALWNEKDPILKERLFGVTGPQGNHGEDVKEYYFYLDGTPTHSYMKMLYKYPQVEFPYEQLIENNQKAGKFDPEFELLDALRDVYEQNLYFDVFIEYAKADQEDILCRITAINRGSKPAPIHILPHLWYRNDWSWGYNHDRPTIEATKAPHANIAATHTNHRHLGDRWWYGISEIFHAGDIYSELLFTENETNLARLYDTLDQNPYVKDSFHEAIINNRKDRTNPRQTGSKFAYHTQSILRPSEVFITKVRFSNTSLEEPFDDFVEIFEHRIDEADQFYKALQPSGLTDDEAQIQRQAFAGLLWSKQFYHYSVELWLRGDPAQPAPPASRKRNRNAGWKHIYALDVLSMPDKWEYPWFAAWDLAFHVLPIAMIDPEWAKRQLILLTREWYMHPNGQLPAYEWSFDDVNPPVHAWAALRVYEIERDLYGRTDRDFLESIFHKLLLNFTWWVNRKDTDGNNVFQGGFLGLDNIGVFDRSKPLPTGGHLDQADGTAWMAMYCLNMLAISLELARTRPAYEDVATKFFEHFIYIANAFYDLGHHGVSLWDEKDGFFYDALHTPDSKYFPQKIRSIVGLIPLFASQNIDIKLLDQLPRFKRRMQWFIDHRPGLVKHVASISEPGVGGNLQLSVVDRNKLERILERVFDPDEFLSDYGLRSLSKHYAKNPFSLNVDGHSFSVTYEPAESSSDLFGGNSNWRGPIWFPMNYLMIQSLREFAKYYGDTLMVELPRGSDKYVSLNQAADELCRRMISIFTRDGNNANRRPVFGDEELMQNDPLWRDNLLFYEYFNGDTGAGIGASHQTGWTALVAKMIQETTSNPQREETHQW